MWNSGTQDKTLKNAFASRSKPIQNYLQSFNWFLLPFILRFYQTTGPLVTSIALCKGVTITNIYNVFMRHGQSDAKESPLIFLWSRHFS